jgi:hypothetical protein
LCLKQRIGDAPHGGLVWIDHAATCRAAYSSLSQSAALIRTHPKGETILPQSIATWMARVRFGPNARWHSPQDGTPQS